MRFASKSTAVATWAAFSYRASNQGGSIWAAMTGVWFMPNLHVLSSTARNDL